MQGRREQRTRGRRQIQRHRLVRSSSSSSGASERAEAAAAGLEEDGEEAGVCANLSYAWVSSQALVCIRMSNGLSLAWWPWRDLAALLLAGSSSSSYLCSFWLLFHFPLARWYGNTSSLPGSLSLGFGFVFLVSGEGYFRSHLEDDDTKPHLGRRRGRRGRRWWGVAVLRFIFVDLLGFFLAYDLLRI